MKKVLQVKEANELELCFTDKTLTARFDMRAVSIMQDELRKIREIRRMPFERIAAIILYSGIKVNHEEFTMDEAVALALTIRPCDLNEIVKDYVESIQGTWDPNEEVKKTIAQILPGIAGLK